MVLTLKSAAQFVHHILAVRFHPDILDQRGIRTPGAQTGKLLVQVISRRLEFGFVFIDTIHNRGEYATGLKKKQENEASFLILNPLSRRRRRSEKERWLIRPVV